VNDLIKIDINDQQQPIVSGRELHDFLDVGTEYAKWFERMSEYGFTAGVDFSPVLTESTGGRPATDHAMTLDMAKELAMLQRNERGKQARQYFIAVEKEYNSPEKTMARALLMADRQIKEMGAKLAIAAPKAEGYDHLMASGDAISIGKLAQTLGTGQNRLFAFLRGQGVLKDDNLPYQLHIDAGRFRVIEQTWGPTDSPHISHKTLVTAKGQDYIRRIWTTIGAAAKERGAI
jgi:anti-repressor protein